MDSSNENLDPFTLAMLRQREHAELKADEFNIRVDQFIETLDREGTMVLRDLMSAIIATSQNPPHLAAHYEGWLAARLQYKFEVCMGCGKKHTNEAALDEALDDILGPRNEENRGDALKPEGEKFVQGTLFEMASVSDSAVEAIYANAEEYGVEVVNLGNPLGAVRCIGCGTENPSLEDRMLREPGVKGCGGCQEKAKWG